MSVIEVTDENYQDFIEENSLAIIDFLGPNCIPCVRFAPHFERLAEEYADRCAFGKYNVDERWEHVAQNFGIRGIPTIIVYKNGTTIERTFVCEHDIPWLKELIQKNLNT